MSSRTIDIFLERLPEYEGTFYHKDITGIETAPLGIVIGNRQNQSIAELVGVTLDKNTSVNDAEKIARVRAEQDFTDLTKSIGDNFTQLKPEYQAIILDAKFNTGANYSNLAKNLNRFQGSPTSDNRTAVINQSRRVVNGKPVRGLDNRVYKVLFDSGVVSSLDEVKPKLTLANTTDRQPRAIDVAKQARDDTLESLTFAESATGTVRPPVPESMKPVGDIKFVGTSEAQPEQQVRQREVSEPRPPLPETSRIVGEPQFTGTSEAQPEIITDRTQQTRPPLPDAPMPVGSMRFTGTSEADPSFVPDIINKPVQAETNLDILSNRVTQEPVVTKPVPVIENNPQIENNIQNTKVKKPPVTYNYGRDELFVTVPNDMMMNPEQSWVDGFKASVAEINMPLLETLQEHRLFGDSEIDVKYDVVQDIIDDGLLPYYPDLIHAKTPMHYDFLKKRVRKALDRDLTAGNAPLTAQLAAGIIGDPLFLTTFIPIIGNIKLGTTISKSALKFGAVGAGFGVASELRRAPFAVAESENESAFNVAATTALSALTGGVVKLGADNLLPFAKASSRKAMGFVKGEVDYVKQTGGDFDPVFGNPLASPAYKVMNDPDASPVVKKILAGMTYNSSVPLQGQRTQSLGQSVSQRAAIYRGLARKHEERMRDLHAQATKGNAKATQIFGAYVAKPFSREFDEFYQETVKKYILTSHPTKGKRILAEASDAEKQAFVEIKSFFDDMDINARDVKLEGFLNDADIKSQIVALENQIAAKSEQLASLEATERKTQGLTSKQRKFESDLDLEMNKLRDRIEDLRFMLDSPTRKSYMFPIFYNKILLKDDSQRGELTKIFEQHYQQQGAKNPRETAETTLSRIMEEDAEELGISRGGKQGRVKHMMHRKTDVDEWMVSDYMDLSIETIYTYAERMGLRIEFKRKFGSNSIDDLLDTVELEGRKAKLSDKKISKHKQAVAGEYDRLMGSIIRNPDRLDNQIVQVAKSWTGWVYLPLSGVAAMTDHANMVFAHGTQKYLEAGLTAMTDANFGNLSKANMRGIGEGLDVAKNFAVRKMLNDSLRRYQPNKLEKFQQAGNQFFYTVNGLGPMTVYAKFLDHMLINDKFIKSARRLRDGTIDKFDREYLYRYGISDELARYLADVPTQKSSTSSLELANTDDWAINTPQQREFLKQYQSATAAHANNTIVYGQAFDKPLIADGVTYIKDNPFFASMRAIYPRLFAIDEKVSSGSVKMVRVESQLMTVPFTFMNFAFGANNKILGAIRDPNRKFRLQGALSILGLAYLSLEIREKLKGNKSFLGKPYRTTLDETARIIDFSGLLGVYSELGYMGLSMAANFGADPEFLPLSPKYLNPDEDQRMADGLTEPFGAPAGLALSYYRAMSAYLGGDIEEGNEELFYSMPFIGHPLVRGDVKDMMVGERYRY